MKVRYMYAVLDLLNDRCWEVGDDQKARVSLPTLLADGWRPVRETADAPGRLLLVLERDGDDPTSFGFGFGGS